VIEEIVREAERRKIVLRMVENREITRLAPEQNTQGVVAEIHPLETVALADLLRRAPIAGGAPLLLVLDQIQDPHNLGAILRTADAVRVDGVVLPRRRSAPLSGVVAKTSAGAIYFLPLADVPNLARALDEIRRTGIWIVGLDERAEKTPFGVDLTVPLALVVGSEGSGLRRLTRERCDILVRLPMAGHVGSLNASVAAGIALFETMRQRAGPQR
jgi:23S rRNA (guanosine2251-2'-O)-methyltransferase